MVNHAIISMLWFGIRNDVNNDHIFEGIFEYSIESNCTAWTLLCSCPWYWRPFNPNYKCFITLFGTYIYTVSSFSDTYVINANSCVDFTLVKRSIITHCCWNKVKHVVKNLSLSAKNTWGIIMFHELNDEGQNYFLHGRSKRNCSSRK